jgi:excisionase family DNA binding protein
VDPGTYVSRYQEAFMMSTLDDLLELSAAARRLGLSADRVRQLIDEGKLLALRTSTGRRLVRTADLEKFSGERERQSSSALAASARQKTGREQ